MYYIAKSVSVVIPSCNDALIYAPKCRRENHVQDLLFPEGSRIIRYIKGNAQILQLSLPLTTFPHIVARPNGGFAVKPLSDTQRDIALTRSQLCSYCLETFNTIARYGTNNNMCVCIEVKEYKNQTESC